MFFQQRASADASLSYLFGCAGHGLAAAVDVVAGDEAWFVDEAKKAGSVITHVIDTHIHADHLSGGPRLARETGARYCLHAGAADVVRFAFEPMQHGQVIAIGNVAVEVRHTPGHTPESICLLVTDKRRGDEPWFVLTGDTLLVGAVGRPDLLGQEREMAGVLFDSLHRELLRLPDAVEVFPGHQAGSACGVGLSGKPSSTIGFERRWNASLATLDRGTFIDAVTQGMPPRPAGMDRIVAANTGTHG
jgi:glyoxylase-like metal-dependent hydrolase (beta-lactamase superfamily II)